MPFRFREVMTLTGASRSQLIHWTDVDLIQARAEESEGTGHHRLFNFQNLVEVRVAVLLAGAGVRVAATAWILAQLRRRWALVSSSRDLVLWLSGDYAKANHLWLGTVDELSRELKVRFAETDTAGFLIAISQVVRELRAKAHSQE